MDLEASNESQNVCIIIKFINEKTEGKKVGIHQN